MGLLRQGGFKLSRREIAQARMNALAVVDISKKTTDLLVGIVKVLVVRQIDFFFLDGADDTLRIAILPGFTDRGRADGNLGFGEQSKMSGGGIVSTLVRVVNLWRGSL